MRTDKTRKEKGGDKKGSLTYSLPRPTSWPCTNLDEAHIRLALPRPTSWPCTNLDEAHIDDSKRGGASWACAYLDDVHHDSTRLSKRRLMETNLFLPSTSVLESWCRVWWPSDMAEEPLGGHLNSTL
ncbi:hypothetical protein GW17_00030289 [Ensete ventricosum]|nr:hypothetical protein GW17_00030289 [Ensete ventricosum]